jgi:GT2 family glycosyltransferase
MFYQLSELPRIPVIVLNWNGWEDTFKCLHSLQSARGVGPVWLVDNGSKVDRSTEAAEHFPGLKVIRFGSNYGWAGAYNKALGIAKTEGHSIAYLLNNDAEVDPGFLVEVFRAYAAHQKAASVGSCIRYLDGSVKFDGEYSPAGARQYNVEDSIVRQSSSSNGSGMLINLTAFETVGGFDERFFCYCEEYEWCRRAAVLGYNHFVALGSVVWHRSEGSDTNANAAYYRGRNLYLMASKRGGLDASPGFLRITYMLYRGANEARRLGQKDRQYAMLQAIDDGIHGRFGKRGKWACPFWLRPVAYTWPFPTGLFRRKAD